MFKNTQDKTLLKQTLINKQILSVLLQIQKVEVIKLV